MSPLRHTLADSATMLGRQLRHVRRNPNLTVLTIGTPVVILLLFVYVFGGTLGAGLHGAGGRAEYLDYITPAIVVMAAVGTAQGTAMSVAADMTGGIVARFRTMAISRGPVLAGHVFGGLITSLLAMSAVLAVAMVLGYRPGAGPLGWFGLLGMLSLTAFALAWLAVAFGLQARSVETATNLPMLLLLLTLLSSGFVPPDSMPSGLRWFAAHQAFTPVIDTVRSLLGDSADEGAAPVAVGWCVAIALVGYLWSRSLYRRRSVG